MSQTNLTDPRAADVLLGALNDKLKRELEERAIASIRPAIREAAAAAVKELEPKIRMHLDHMSNELTIQLLFGDAAKGDPTR